MRLHRPNLGIPGEGGATRKVCVAFAATVLILLAGCQAASTGSADEVKLLITPVPTPTATPAAQPTAAPVTYIVKTGDTLSGIADIFGVTVDDIVRTNNIADPNALQVGQTLTIPGRRLPSSGATATSGGTPGTQTGATPAPFSGTVTPVIVPPNVLPPDATPPQGPTVPEPGGVAASPSPSSSSSPPAPSSPSPAISPTSRP